MDIRIEKRQTADLKNWFTVYVSNYADGDFEQRRNIKLKINHSKRVCKEIINIGRLLGLNQNELRFAEIIALFHDIGRFEQYSRYKTFLDSKSENHAKLGAKILKKTGILNQFEESVKNLILKTIIYHNRAELPDDETETCLFFARLLRDADKLDIWKVVTDYYYQKDGRRNGAIELDLPDTPGFSEEVYQDLMNESIVDMKHVKNLNDFKLLQMGWIFDVNFKPTFRCIKSRRYVELISHILPRLHEIQKITDAIQLYLHKHADEKSQ